MTSLINEFKLSINKVPIKRETSVKFLGMTLMDNLSWFDHITNIVSKINKNIGILYKIKNKLTHESMKMFYYSFVYTYMFYRNLIWGNCPCSHLDKLYKCQKSIPKIIL